MSARILVFSLLICLFSGSGLFSQSNAGRLYTEIHSALAEGKVFSRIQIVNLESESVQLHYQKTYSKANYWSQDSRAFSKLKEASPRYIKFELVDYYNNKYTVFQLIRYSNYLILYA